MKCEDCYSFDECEEGLMVEQAKYLLGEDYCRKITIIDKIIPIDLFTDLHFIMRGLLKEAKQCNF